MVGVLMTATIWLLHLGATLAMTGLIWLVQVVHYPLFAEVGPEAFHRYHEGHTRLITFVVLPLMGIELITAGWLALRPPLGLAPWTWLGLGLVALAWASTMFVQVPLHSTLSQGFDPAAHHALVRTNWVRTVAWTIRAVLWLALTARYLLEVQRV